MVNKMKVFKFGGASIKDAAAIRNVRQILGEYADQSLVVVVSAMGKTTNMLEKVVSAYTAKNTEELQQNFKAVKIFYDQICNDLFGEITEKLKPYTKLISQLEAYLQNEVSDNYDFEYDQIVSFGEMCSSTIMSIYLNETECDNQFLDVRKVIKTDQTFREGKVNWKQTEKAITETVTNLFQKSSVI